MSTGKNIISGLAWGQIGMSGRTLITFLISIIVARVLGVENYGLYAVLISLVELMIKTTDMGIYATLTTYIPRLLHSSHPGEGSFVVRRTLLGRNLLLLVVAAVFVRFSSPFTVWMGAPDIDQYLTVTALLFLVRGFMDGFVFIVIARVEMKYYSSVEIGVSILQLLGVFFLVATGLDVGKLVMLMVLVNGTQCLFYGIRSLPLLKPKPIATPMAKIWKFGLTTWFGNILQYFRFKSIDVLMLLYFLHDKKAVAHYEIAYLLVVYGGRFFATALDRLAMTLLSQAQARHGLKGMGETWTFLTKLSIVLTVPVFVFLIAHASSIIDAVYSEAFAPAAPLMVLLSILSLASVCLAQGTSYELLFPLGKEKVFVVLSAFNGVLNIGSAFILIPLIGAPGVVIATGGSALVTDMIALAVALKALQIRFPRGFVLQILLITAAAVSWTLLLGKMTLLKLIAAALLYGVMVIGLTLRFHRFSHYEKATLRGFRPQVFDRLVKYGLLR
ncbi:MAG: lipopolysaccharide biosynthesis protein [Nitrospinales bacterium]